MLTCTSTAVDWLCANHLICWPVGPTATPPLTVTPFTFGPTPSIRSCPVPTAPSGVAPPFKSTATTVKLTGASELLAWAEHGSAASQTFLHEYEQRPSLHVAPSSAPPSVRVQSVGTLQEPSDGSPL